MAPEKRSPVNDETVHPFRFAPAVPQDYNTLKHTQFVSSGGEESIEP